MPLLEAVLDVNAAHSRIACSRGFAASVPDLHDARVTVLGLAFKPDTDDVRESPAFPIIERLSRREQT